MKESYREEKRPLAEQRQGLLREVGWFVVPEPPRERSCLYGLSQGVGEGRIPGESNPVHQSVLSSGCRLSARGLRADCTAGYRREGDEMIWQQSKMGLEAPLQKRCGKIPCEGMPGKVLAVDPHACLASYAQFRSSPTVGRRYFRG
jgi:hypothetical protein